MRFALFYDHFPGNPLSSHTQVSQSLNKYKDMFLLIAISIFFIFFVFIAFETYAYVPLSPMPLAPHHGVISQICFRNNCDTVKRNVALFQQFCK